MKFEKPDKSNVFKNIIRNIADSNRGLLIMAKESSTVQCLIPLEIIAALIAGLLTKFNAIEYVILAVILIVLFTTETINSAIEEVNDLVTDQINEKVKRSKDLASASVWIWHLMYIGAFLFFLICHLVHFAWWTAIIPA